MINQRSVSYSSQRTTSINPESLFVDSANTEAIHSVKKKFWWFSVVASINHALNYVVTSYATSLLGNLLLQYETFLPFILSQSDSQLGGVILGLSWSLNAVSGLTVATAVVRRFGFKYAMIISLWGYTCQIASLYLAIMIPHAAWPIAIIGAVVSGFTSAIWWTAQGVYFEQSCVEIEKLYVHNELSEIVSVIDSIRANLSAHWTIIYQVSDIVVFLALSIIPLIGGVAISSVILGLTFVGVLTSLLGYTFDPLGTVSGEMSWNEVTEAIVAVPKQVARDARVSLLAPFVFGFGISTAMFAYFVNSNIVSDSSGLGTLTLGFLEAFSYFIAVISAYPYAYVSNAYPKGQDYVIQFGTLSFLLSGVVVLSLSSEQLGTWQNILIAKALYGLGRGVFEGSCRAVYAGMFTGKDLSTAFSAQTLSVGFSGGICFFLFGVLSKTSIAAITVGNGVVALCSYLVLMYFVDAKAPLSWGRLCALCCCAAQSHHTVESSAERAVSKYAQSGSGKASQSSSLNRSLLEHSQLSEGGDWDSMRSSEADIRLIDDILHHKMHTTPTHSKDVH